MIKYSLVSVFLLTVTLTIGQQNDLNSKKDLTHAEEIIGTWNDSIPFPNGFVTSKGTMVINSDSILIKRRYPGRYRSTQILKYEVKDDTIIAKEIKFISIDENAGIAHRYYKNRQLISKIPMCHFSNTCFTEKPDRLTNPSYRSLCIKQSTQSEIRIEFKQALSEYRILQRRL